MDKHFGGVIWTNHALQRLTQRGIKQGDAWATWKRPNQSRFAQTKGAWIFYRKIGKRLVEVVAKKNDRGEWIIMSVWDKPFSPIRKSNQGNSSPGWWKWLVRWLGKL